jgi:hypothetical protein
VTFLAASSNQVDTILAAAASSFVVAGGAVGALRWFIIHEFRTLKDSHDEEKRLSEAVAKTLLGPNVVENPGQVDPTPSLRTVVENVAHQMRPSNGKTMAQILEDTQREMYRLAILMGEHMSDGHGAQVWPGANGR